MLGGQRTGIAGLINTHEDGASIHAASQFEARSFKRKLLADCSSANPLLSTWLFNGTRGPGDRQLGSWDREQQMHPRRAYAIDARAHYGIDTANISTHL